MTEPWAEQIAVCNVCGWRESWTTREAAEAAAVVHVHDEHRDIWIERQGWDKPLPDTPPEAYGRRLETWESQG